MENKDGPGMKQNVLAAAFTACAAFSGLAFIGRCSGGGCSACLGCAAPGLGILLFAAIKKAARAKPPER